MPRRAGARQFRGGERRPPSRRARAGRRDRPSGRGSPKRLPPREARPMHRWRNQPSSHPPLAASHTPASSQQANARPLPALYLVTSSISELSVGCERRGELANCQSSSPVPRSRITTHPLAWRRRIGLGASPGLDFRARLPATAARAIAVVASEPAVNGRLAAAAADRAATASPSPSPSAAGLSLEAAARGDGGRMTSSSWQPRRPPAGRRLRSRGGCRPGPAGCRSGRWLQWW